MSLLKQPLSNVQLELLKLYSTNLSESEMEELKLQLAKFYANRAIKLADRGWDEKDYTNDDMDKLLNDCS